MFDEQWMKETFGFLLISFKKRFFPKFVLLNSGCGLSAGVYCSSVPYCMGIARKTLYTVQCRSVSPSAGFNLFMQTSSPLSLCESGIMWS